MFGGPGFFGAPRGGGGLPFGGIPEELAERATAILATEPDHPTPDVPYSPIAEDARPFTLARFVAPLRLALVGTGAIVVLETVALQAGPWLTQVGIDRGISRRDTGVLVAVTLAYVASVLVSMVAGGVRVAVTGRLGERLTYDLRVRVFSHLQRLGLDFYTGERQGRVLTRMTSDIDNLTVLFQDGLVNLTVQGLTLVVVGGILLALNPLLAGIVLLAIVPLMVAVTLWFRSASDTAYNRVRDRIADVLSDLSENLAGMRVVMAANRRRHNLVAHTNLVGEHREANLEAARIGAVYGPVSETIGVLGQAVLLGVGGWLVLHDRLTVGELFAFLLYLTSFFAPIQQLVQLYTTYQSGRSSVVKLGELLATPPSVPEAPGAAELAPIEGHIRFDDVTFAYDTGRPVLEHVDLEVRPGEVLAVVGPTGAGKSTIAKLITRFYDPQHGSVSIDGVDLRTVTLRSLRSQLGVVPQEAFLFSGTLRDNVAFGRPDAPEDEVTDAVAAVGLDGLVARLPLGLDTEVHERGVSLSAGERQLLALARAFLARPRVLVLDEATSNLDLASEQQVEGALDRVLEGRTAVIIAHRLATARRADRIAVIDHGRLVELGSHTELVATGGRYAAMYAAWIRNATS